jgi:hypothetical protein
VKIVTFDSASHEVSLPRTFTCLEVKNYIYISISQSLEVKSMSLFYEGTKLANYLKLTQINIVVGSQLVIKQEKLSLHDVSSIISKAHGIDGISE